MAELEHAEKHAGQLEYQLQTLLLDNKELAGGIRHLLEENKRLRKENTAIQKDLEPYSTPPTVSTPITQSDRTPDETIVSKRIELPDYILSKALNAELEWYRHTLNQTLEKFAREEGARHKLEARFESSIQDTPSRVPSFEDAPQGCVLTIEDAFIKDILEPPQTKKGTKNEDHEFVLDSGMVQSLVHIQRPADQFPTALGAYIDVTQSLEDLANSQRTQKSQRSSMRRRESIVVEHSGRSEYDEARVSGVFSPTKRNPDGDEGDSPSSSTDAVAAVNPSASSNSSSRRRRRMQSAISANPRSMSDHEFDKDDNVAVPLRPHTSRKLDSPRRRRSTPEEASPPIQQSSSSETVLSDPFPRTAEGRLILRRKRNALKNGKQLHNARAEGASDSGNAIGSEPIFSIAKKQVLAPLA
jgi:hypothetical protein